ncbi:MAG TPA: S8 family serine peptidase [Gemmatimonadaceae bacterium]
MLRPPAALDRILGDDSARSGDVPRRGSGAGVTIYVFDGGVADDHPELASRVRIGYDAFPSVPRICNPHGTAVAAVAAGATLGLSPRAEIVDVKIIECRTARGSLAAILAAAKWTAGDHRRNPGPAVANWSFVVDTNGAVAAIDSAVRILHDAGILVVAAAGNYDIDACRVSPGSSGGTIVVGATGLLSPTSASGRREMRVPETAWGPCVDIYAPGDSVVLRTASGDMPARAVWTGTSLAAGYVSGAASLVLERAPASSPEIVKREILANGSAGAVDEGVCSRPGVGRLLHVGAATPRASP